MGRVSWLAPGAEIDQLLDVPAAATDAWKKLMHPETSHADAHGRHNELVFGQDAIAHYLGDDHVLLDLAVADRDSLFAKLAGLLEQRYDLAAEAVAAGLAAREALGSTAPGQGVAVPHGQIKGLAQPLALYVRPIRPIAFDAPDGAPVTDLVALFVPEWANMMHLQLLADVTQRFCDQHFREQLHACHDPQAVCKLFAECEARDAGTDEPDAGHHNRGDGDHREGRMGEKRGKAPRTQDGKAEVGERRYDGGESQFWSASHVYRARMR